MQYAPIYGRGGDVTLTKGGTFDAVIYAGGALRIQGWDLPVVVDLVGLRPGKLLVANLDHKSTQRVGIIDELDNNGRRLRAVGRLNAATKFRDEVIESHREGYQWQASIEAHPMKSRKSNAVA